MTKSLQNTSEAASHRRCDVKKDVLKNLANLTGKHLCWSLFLTKLKAWRCATLSKRDSNTGAFLWNLLNVKNTYFEKHLRTITPDTSRGVKRSYWARSQRLNIYKFSVVIYHVQCIIICDSASRERSNLQQLPKII